MNGRCHDVESTREAVRRAVARQRPGSPTDLSGRTAEVEELLAALDEFQPICERQPVVARLALLETPAGRTPLVENIVMPPARHDLLLLVKGLNFMRQERGLRTVAMPMFLHPDELAVTLRDGPPCLCDAYRALDARKRSRRRLGIRRVRPVANLTRDVLVRDEWKCTRCGSESDLHVHRIDADAPTKDRAAYVTLCRSCHVAPRSALPPALSQNGETPPIDSQLAVFFQRGRVRWVGFAFGRDYVVIEQ